MSRDIGERLYGELRYRLLVTVNFVVACGPDDCFATIECTPRFPPLRPRGIAPLQLNLPFAPTVAVHSAVNFDLAMYVTVAFMKGSKLAPSKATTVRFFPDPGEAVSDGEGGGGVLGVTVRTAVPEMSPEVAVMVVAPVATPLARPWEPDALEIVAVEVSDDDHVTDVVRLAVLRSE
jgi:hypothetical protein